MIKNHIINHSDLRFPNNEWPTNKDMTAPYKPNTPPDAPITLL